MAEALQQTTVPDHRTGYAPAGALRLHYRAFGEPGATPALIAHGMSYFSYDWIDVAAALAGDREVVAFDQRGFGESSWPDDRDYSPRGFAADIDAMLDHLGWDRVVLIGHSMGGRNVTWYAGDHPERVAAMVLVDWSPQTSPAGSKRVRETNGRLPDAFASIDAAMAYFGKDPHSPTGARARARFEAFLRPVPGGFALKRDTLFRDRSREALQAGRAPGLVADGEKVDMWGRLSRVTCPILVLRGTKSDMFAADAVPKVRAATPNVTLVEVEAGHDVAGQNPDALLREVRPFLARF
jgi:pimeloyl-ACP methyl ester carboxylesterase